MKYLCANLSYTFIMYYVLWCSVIAEENRNHLFPDGSGNPAVNFIRTNEETGVKEVMHIHNYELYRSRTLFL